MVFLIFFSYYFRIISFETKNKTLQFPLLIFVNRRIYDFNAIDTGSIELSELLNAKTQRHCVSCDEIFFC